MWTEPNTCEVASLKLDWKGVISMSEHPLVGAIKAQSGLLIGLGILTLVLGFLAIGSPFVAGISVAIVVGCLLLINGIGQIFFAFQAGSFGPGLLAFILGGLTVICAVMMLAHPIFGLGVLTIILMAYLFVEGIFEVFVAFQIRTTLGWGWIAFSGIVSVILGIVLWWDWPVTGEIAIDLLLGIKLIFLAVWMLQIGFAGRSVANSVSGDGN